MKARRAQSESQASVPAPGRRERRRQETRERIYRAALRLFAERGFFETTTEQITEAADVGQGTFFNYFPSKQHVFVVFSEIQLTRVRAAREQALNEATPIRDILHRLIHDIAKEPGQSQPLTRALFSAFLSSDTVRELVGATMAKGRDEFASIIAARQERGEIRRDVKAVDLALGFQRAVSGTLLLWCMQAGPSLRTLLDKAFVDFWAGAAAPRGSR